KTMAATAEILGCCEQTVLNRRKRFLARRSEGAVAALTDLPRSGRPVTYGPQERAQITAIVCETLWERKLPLSRFSIADLRRWSSRKRAWLASATAAWGVFSARMLSNRGAIATGSSRATLTL
ncbi:MAG: hypothetical protein ACE5JP_17820, partial [Candidatus Bipolaricaulia bacterium]